MHGKKGIGALSTLLSAGILIVVLGIVFGLGGQIVGDIGAGAADDSGLANSTADSAASIDKMSGYLPTIALVIVVGVILSILIVYLYNRFVR